MGSHPELGKTRGLEGERRSTIPRLLEHTRVVVKAIFRGCDRRIAMMLSNRLFAISCWSTKSVIDSQSTI